MTKVTAEAATGVPHRRVAGLEATAVDRSLCLADRLPVVDLHSPRPLLTDNSSLAFRSPVSRITSPERPPLRCLLEQDQYQAPVTWSGESSDLCASVRGQVVFSPKQGDAHLAVTAEKAFPMPGPAAGLLGDNWLSFVRMRVRAEREIPVGPITVVAHGKGGAIWGDLPPYEAFAIGGTNSVRGYEEGGVGTGRKCMVGTIEARVPLVSAVSGVAFVDYGTDCGTGETVSGDPAGTRGKPGAGYGVGAGLR